MAFAVEPYIFDLIFFDDSSTSKLGGFHLHGDRQQNVPLGCISLPPIGSVCAIYFLTPRFAWVFFSRSVFDTPNPLAGGTFGVAPSSPNLLKSKRLAMGQPFDKASLFKGRFGGIVNIVADSSAKRTKKAIIKRLSLCVERKTRVCPSALYSVYQAIAFAQYYTPNSRDTWVVSRCRFRVRLLPYKLQNYSCLRQIYE